MRQRSGRFARAADAPQLGLNYNTRWPHVLRYTDIRRGVLLIANYSPLASNLDRNYESHWANTWSCDDEYNKCDALSVFSLKNMTRGEANIIASLKLEWLVLYSRIFRSKEIDKGGSSNHHARLLSGVCHASTITQFVHVTG